jgi:radical SAM superfamily enzyme YgiQ (UPF0313 family)
VRVLIVSANFIKMPYPVYPLGAGIIAEIARRNGHEVRLLDLLSAGGFGGYKPEKLFEVITEFRPDCVGLSLRNLESTDSSNFEQHWSLDLVKRMVADIRAKTNAPQVIGGAGFSLMPETILKHTGADYGLAGEGEEIWPAFLDALAAKAPTPGLWAKSRPVAHQASAYDLELVKSYAQQGGLVGVQTKRGCEYNCVYCSYPLLDGCLIRLRPVEEVLDDLRRLASVVERPHIAFADSVFNDPAGHWRTLLAAMASASDLKLSWTAFFQPANFEKEDWRLMKSTGVSGLEFGTDGSNDVALGGLNKPFGFGLVTSIQNQCLANDISTAHYIIFGGPYETPVTVEEGVKNVNSLKGCVAFITTGLSIYPNTPLAELALREGLIDSFDDLLKPVYYFSADLDPDLLDCRLHKAFDTRRDRLYPTSEALERTEVLRRMGYRGIMWDTLIGGASRGRQRTADG